MIAKPDSKKRPATSVRCDRGAWKLALVITITVWFWCIVLPWYARQPAMREHLQFLDDRGIDPSAMFYTELEAMDAILKKLEGGG